MRLLLILSLFTSLVLTGCGNGDEQANSPIDAVDPINTTESSESIDDAVEETVDEGLEQIDETEDEVEEIEEEIEQVVQEETFPFHYPLTGFGTESEFNHRVIGVMINNHSRARPQSGLHKADVVYEVLAEGNITRFLALYHSEFPEFVGPIRSARHYYMDLNNGYNGFYIHHGWSPLAHKMVKNRQVENLNGLYYDGSLFYRSKERKAPHNSYISFDSIFKGAKKKGYKVNDEVKSLPFLSKEEMAEYEGQDAIEIKIKYAKSYNVSYSYDSDNELYYRYSNGIQTLDKETSIPIIADNIFIVAVPHYFIDSYPRRGLDLTSGGKGYLIGKGMVREVEWQNVDGRILPFENGNEVGFIPGRTWINIIPTDPGLTSSVTITGRE
jgi:hypothetical protein